MSSFRPSDPGASSVPYVIGQWVRGSRFYGRQAELGEILSRLAPVQWIAGLRRVGKTSLLKQLEHLALEGQPDVVPLFWDFQGVEGAEDLALSFADSLLDAEEILEERGVDPGEVEDDDLLTSIGRLGEALEKAGCRLLLLMDEVDEIFRPDLGAGSVFPELWPALLALEGTRFVLAGSVKACDPPPRLVPSQGQPAQNGTTQEQALYLGSLTDGEARALLTQDQLPPAARPDLREAAVNTLCQAAGGHPMLLQMLGKRCWELGDAEAALASFEGDRSLGHLFAIDLDLLAPAEVLTLRRLALGSSAEEASLGRLRALGIVAGEGAETRIANRLLAAWLRETS